MLAGVLGTGLPVWCEGVAAPPSVAGLTFVGWQEPIACGGVAVFPDDVVVVDDDGAVLIPAALARSRFWPRRRNRSGWKPGSWTEVDRGVPLPGLYPMNEDTKARYAAWKSGAMTFGIDARRRLSHRGDAISPDGRSTGTASTG